MIEFWPVHAAGGMANVVGVVDDHTLAVVECGDPVFYNRVASGFGDGPEAGAIVGPDAVGAAQAVGWASQAVLLFGLGTKAGLRVTGAGQMTCILGQALDLVGTQTDSRLATVGLGAEVEVVT